jgi:hypothetical protein
MRLLRHVPLLALLTVGGCTATLVDAPAERAVSVAAPVPEIQVAEGADRFPIVVQDRWGYIDRSGAVVIEPRFGEAHAFEGGLARVAVAGRYGYIDPSGAVVIEPRFLQAFDFSAGRARVVLPSAALDARSRSASPAGRRLEAFIDTEGAVVVPAVLTEARDFGEARDAPLAPVVRTRTRDYLPLGIGLLSFLRLRLQDAGAWEVIGPDGQVALRLEDANEVLGLTEGRFAFATNVGGWPFTSERWGYLDAEGAVSIEPRFVAAFGFSEGRAAVVVDDRFGYVDTTGALAIPPRFEFARPFVSGRAAVRLDGRWGFVDSGGRLVIPAQYDLAFEFSDDRALVARDGRFGFVDPAGAEAIPLRFDYARSFRNGLAYVRAGTQEGYIDATGAFVWTRPAPR